MTISTSKGQGGYFWSYLKLLTKIILSEPGRLVPHVRDGFRYYRNWKRSLDQGGDPLIHRIPWVPFSCQDFIGRSIGPESVVFEYGSGGSTLYFSDRVKHLVSVEHHEDWYTRVKNALEEGEIRNSEYHLEIPTSNTAGGDPGPCPFGYDGDGYPGMTFYRYASKIDDYEDCGFDLVMVDGRARNACLWHARRKVKPGGYLVLDNAEREEYRAGIELMKNWQARQFTGVLPYMRDFCQTMVWEKPDQAAKDNAVQQGRSGKPEEPGLREP